MSAHHTRPLTRLYFRRNVAAVDAAANTSSTQPQASTGLARRRRRPPSPEGLRRRIAGGTPTAEYFKEQKRSGRWR